MTVQTKRPIDRATDAELREFAELTLQLTVPAMAARGDILAQIRQTWPADHIFVDQAELVDGQLPQSDAVRAEAQINLSTAESAEDPKWLIKIAATELPGGKDPVAVSVNGRNVVIQRGVEVAVPHRYVEALRNAIRVSVAQDPKTQEFSYSTFTNYPFEPLDRPTRSEIAEWEQRVGDKILA